MMNTDVKTKWVAALRSGQYTQGRHMLEQSGKHCCLGVLCEVSKAENGFGIDQNRIGQGGGEILSITIMRWAGLKYPKGDSVQIGGNTEYLSRHNDSCKTFAQIADAIEAQL